MTRSYAALYEAYDALQAERRRRSEEGGRQRNALQAFMHRAAGGKSKDGFARIETCRQALDALDRRGWLRSFHQRMFHENFIRACARVFFKTEPLGNFARAHQTILDLNGWDTLSQEILISTPRRFGKTISVSMFAAAMVFSAPAVELSIYSTCKRISQKLLRNVQKFLSLIHEGTGVPAMKEIRCNMEEIVLQGPEGSEDVRVVNSYPSKVPSAGAMGTCPRPFFSKWRGATVLCPKRWERSRARAKCSSTNCSASPCRASRASAVQRRSLLKSPVISRTRRWKVARGTL